MAVHGLKARLGRWPPGSTWTRSTP